MSQQIETYTLKQIGEFAKEYKFCSLTDVNGHQKMNWNGYSTPMKEHYQKCLKRFDSVALPKGYYYFCFSNSMKKTNDPDRFLVCKGSPDETPVIINNHNGLRNNIPVENALTMTAALSYIEQISDLKSQLQIVTSERDKLQQENEVLNAYFDAEDNDEDSLSDSPKDPISNIGKFLQDSKPEFLAVFDRFMTNKEKDRELEYAKLKAKNGSGSGGSQKNGSVKQMEVGSKAHLALIRNYCTSGQDDKMNEELDKLEAHDKNLYDQICNELNITEE